MKCLLVLWLLALAFHQNRADGLTSRLDGTEELLNRLTACLNGLNTDLDDLVESDERDKLSVRRLDHAMDVYEGKRKWCEDGYFPCPGDEFQCVPDNFVCDGINDCKSGDDEDEERCSSPLDKRRNFVEDAWLYKCQLGQPQLAEARTKDPVRLPWFKSTFDVEWAYVMINPLALRILTIPWKYNYATESAVAPYHPVTATVGGCWMDKLYGGGVRAICTAQMINAPEPCYRSVLIEV